MPTSNGKKFDGGINDIVVTANGGAYATVFGPYADLPTTLSWEKFFILRLAARNGSR